MCKGFGFALPRCIPKVRNELPKAFPSAKHMRKTEPLSIDADAKVSDSVGFKVPGLHFVLLSEGIMIQLDASDKLVSFHRIHPGLDVDLPQRTHVL